MVCGGGGGGAYGVWGCLVCGVGHMGCGVYGVWCGAYGVWGVWCEVSSIFGASLLEIPLYIILYITLAVFIS